MDEEKLEILSEYIVIKINVFQMLVKVLLIYIKKLILNYLVINWEEGYKLRIKYLNMELRELLILSSGTGACHSKLIK